VAGTVGALALVGAGYQVGHTGGKLVYQYGAASAYTDGNTVVRAGEVTTDRATTSDDDDR